MIPPRPAQGLVLIVFDAELTQMLDDRVAAGAIHPANLVPTMPLLHTAISTG
jgi:hypothetical protein